MQAGLVGKMAIFSRLLKKTRFHFQKTPHLVVFFLMVICML